MIQRRLIAVLSVGACLFALSPVQGETLTLSDALAVAYQSNPKLQGARAAVAALDQGVAQANAGWRPNISASTSYGFERGSVTGLHTPFDSNPLSSQVTVTQPIFRGGRTYAQIGQAIYQVRAGRSGLRLAEGQVLYSGIAAYMDVVRDTAALKLYQKNVQMLERQLEAVRTQFQAGAVTRPDVSQTRARLARARADEAGAEQRLTVSRANFENVIGRPAETLEEKSILPPVPANEDTALAIALKSSPTIAQAKANLRAADYAVDEAFGAMLPQISVTGQYQYLRDAAGNNLYATKNPQSILSVLGQVTVPIYQGGGEEATVRRAKDLRRQAESETVSAERSVREDLASAWKALSTTKAAIAESEVEAKEDESALEGVIEQQQAGERSVLDVLNAEQELVSAQVAVITSRHDNVLASYRLLNVTGQLTAGYLRLKVQPYDPREHYDENAAAWFGLGE